MLLVYGPFLKGEACMGIKGRFKSWYHQRRKSSGIGEIVGGIGSLLLLAFMLTASVSAFHLWQEHQIMERASSVALKSEEKYGCWTSQTTSNVSLVLQNGGINPRSVSVPSYTSTLQPYGSPVKVTLDQTTSSNYVFGSLVQHAEDVSQSGNSSYVDYNTANTTSNCAVPNLAPVVVPVINGVYFSNWTSAGATMTIDGTGFGNSMPLTYSATNGYNNSNSLAINYDGSQMGYYGQGSNQDVDGVTYTSWNNTQIVIQYPGTWSSGEAYPLNGGSMTVDVWNGEQEASQSVNVPANQTQFSVSGMTSSTGNAISNSSVITVNGNNLPILSPNSAGVTANHGGYDYPNFLFSSISSISSTLPAGPSASYYGWTGDGSQSGMWGVNVISSTGSQLKFSVTGNVVAYFPAWHVYLSESALTNASSLSGTLDEPWTISLNASPTSLTIGSSTTLSASTNYNVSPVDETIAIIDSTTGQTVDTCTSGESCSTTYTTNTEGSQSFVAKVQSPASSGNVYYQNPIVQSSNVNVAFNAPTVTLSASNSTPSIGQSTTLTATSNFAASGEYLNIWNTSTSTLEQACNDTETCSVAVSNASPVSYNYQAALGPYGTAPSYSERLAYSNQETITWEPPTLTLTANPGPTLSPGEGSTITATASAPIDGEYLNIWNITTGQFVATAYNAQTTSYYTNSANPASDVYQADIGSYGAYPNNSSNWADSNQLDMNWVSPTLTLTTSNSSPAMGSDTTLTATASSDLYGQYINIWDTSSNTFVGGCYIDGSNQCSESTSSESPGNQVYQADIGSWYAQPGNGYNWTNSNQLNIDWVAPTITLSPASDSVSLGDNVYLTATASSNLYGQYINIYNSTTGAFVSGCWVDGSNTCGVYVQSTTVQTYDYYADISPYYNNNYYDTWASSNTSAITWVAPTISLSSSTYSTSINDNAYLNAVASSVPNGDYIDIYDTSTNTLVQSCYEWDGYNQCSVNVSNSSPMTQAYQAIISPYNDYWARYYSIANSNTVTVTWTGPTLNLYVSSNPNPSTGQASYLTADSSQELTGSYINIWNTTTNTVVSSCYEWYGYSCTGDVSYNYPTTDTFQADIGNYESPIGASSNWSNSNTVSITWSQAQNPEVSSISTYTNVSPWQVVVNGSNLPILSNAGGKAVSYGYDFNNFLFSQSSVAYNGANADGNPSIPYNPDWGINVLSSSSNQLIFTMPGNTGDSYAGTWYLYLLPSGQSINAGTSFITSTYYGY